MLSVGGRGRSQIESWKQKKKTPHWASGFREIMAGVLTLWPGVMQSRRSSQNTYIYARPATDTHTHFCIMCVACVHTQVCISLAMGFAVGRSVSRPLQCGVGYII